MSAASADMLPIVPAAELSGRAFDDIVRGHGLEPLVRTQVTTLQVNVGKLCNMACHHCHVEAGPKRTEIMPRRVAERIVTLLELNPGVEVVDLTGRAPELNPNFRYLVTAARRLGRRVIDHCNLTILFEPGMDGLAEFLAAQQVHSPRASLAIRPRTSRGSVAAGRSTR